MTTIESAIEFALKQKSISSRDDIDIQASSVGIDFVKLVMNNGRVLTISVRSLEDQFASTTEVNAVETSGETRSCPYVLLASPFLLLGLVVMYMGASLIYATVCTNAWQYPGSGNGEDYCLGDDTRPK